MRQARFHALLVFALLLAAPACSGRDGAERQASVIVLGFDGMDHGLTQELIAAGQMPNFEKLAQMGSFAPLATSIPPQSPVAWSNFITGKDAGEHGIFDFIHRDPATMLPYLSTSRAEPGKTVRVGRWRIPLSGGDVKLLRRGRAFWEVLGERGIETTIVRIPANFPPAGSATRELSGMGTPDLLGTYGTFTYFTSEASESAEKTVSGGRIVAGGPVDGIFRGTLHGPENPLAAEPRPSTSEFAVHIDPDRPLAKLVAGGEERLLEVGQWSDWVPIDFGLGLGRSVRGICRFYLKSLRPAFALYVTPVNLDPMQPALPISSPGDWAADLARSTGRFYTQGMPEDTKALTAGVFEPREFLAQAHLADGENLAQYRTLLERHRGGLFFHYFGAVDLTSHMMWRSLDPGHPAYVTTRDEPFADVVPGLYREMDAIVGWTLERMPPGTLLVVMSDHGFASWRRAFHLNAWLQEEGYLIARDPEAVDPGGLTNVDWSRTRAYGLGLNGLYINLRGRERDGIVPEAERQALADEIATKLRATTDPLTGAPAVTQVDRSDVLYTGRGALEVGPDVVVGYAKGTRCSEESALGAVVGEVFTDNSGAWSGDHCMDATAVPGILLTSRPLRVPARSLSELGAAIVAEFEASPAP